MARRDVDATAASVLHGAVLGSVFIIVLPQFLSIAKDWLPAGMAPSGLQAVVFGLVLILGTR